MQLADLVYLPRSDQVAKGFDCTRLALVSSSLCSVLLSWVVAVLLPSATLIPPMAAILTGVVVIVGGATLRIWSVKTLGPHFSRFVEFRGTHELISVGPYRLIRHPAYCGGILMFFGMGLVTGNWVSTLAALAVLLLGRIPRVLTEERALETRFGRYYTDYKQETSRFIPWIL